MATQVAPEQEAMAGLKAQPKVPGNGCCMCCGGAPPDIDVRKITALGGKYAQAGSKRNQKDDSQLRVLGGDCFSSTASPPTDYPIIHLYNNFSCYNVIYIYVCVCIFIYHSMSGLYIRT